MGAVVVPINPAFKQAELEFNFRSAGVSAIIATSAPRECASGSPRASTATSR